MHDLDDPVRSQFLLRERYVVIVSAQHPDVDASGDIDPQDTFDLDLYCRLPHALHSLVGGTIGNVDAALAAINRRRHVALSVPHFFSIAKAVADSQMIATFPERLAARIAPVLGLRVYRAPIDLAPISLAMIWHRRNDSDAGQIWFRQQVAARDGRGTELELMSVPIYGPLRVQSNRHMGSRKSLFVPRTEIRAGTSLLLRRFRDGAGDSWKQATPLPVRPEAEPVEGEIKYWRRV